MAISGAILIGCGSGVSENHSPIRVVAAENFYGSLAKQIAGDKAQVTSILTSPDADPHLFQPATDAGEAVATADVVIENGVGYDPWMERLLEAAPNPDRIVVDASEVIGVTGSDPNPHLWYAVSRLPTVIGAMANAFERADPSHQSSYRRGRIATINSLRPLTRAVGDLRAGFRGDPVAYTERVPGLLLEDAGLQVRTPPSFARAIEDGIDPSPRDVAAMQHLLSERQVDALLYNSQATSPITERLKQLAGINGIPVVPLTETLPPGKTFVEWQLGQVRELIEALHRWASG